MSKSPEEILKELGLNLPDAPKPLGAYVPAVRAGNLLFLSGMLPLILGELQYQGKLGMDLTIEQGYESARTAVLNALAVIRQEIGDLSRVARVVRLTGYVTSAPGFTQQAAVLNGASDLLLKMFGERGKHARLALGAAELPLSSPIELELIISLEN
ncbi:MAG TPA: RidA family protein [Nitrospiria bacterium]|jgi:enamine deaminase RidA (YjgF/YER057c/UK114 family)|nr:RidA family protein [Nitrospiria bacterium]